MKEGLWQEVTCENFAGMNYLLSSHIKRYFFSLQSNIIIGSIGSVILDVKVHSYKQAGTNVLVNVEIRCTCPVKPVRLGRVRL